MNTSANAYKQSFKASPEPNDLLRALLLKGIRLLSEAEAEPDDASKLRKSMQYNNDLWLFLNDCAIDNDNNLTDDAREWIGRSADLSITIGNRILNNALEVSFIKDQISLNRILLERVGN